MKKACIVFLVVTVLLVADAVMILSCGRCGHKIEITQENPWGCNIAPVPMMELLQSGFTRQIEQKTLFPK